MEPVTTSSTVSSSVRLTLARLKVAQSEAEVRQLEKQLEEGRQRLDGNRRDVAQLQRQSYGQQQTERTQVSQAATGRIAQRGQPDQLVYPPLQPAVKAGAQKLVSTIQNLGSIINVTA